MAFSVQILQSDVAGAGDKVRLVRVNGLGAHVARCGGHSETRALKFVPYNVLQVHIMLEILKMW